MGRHTQNKKQGHRSKDTDGSQPRASPKAGSRFTVDMKVKEKKQRPNGINGLAQRDKVTNKTEYTIKMTGFRTSRNDNQLILNQFLTGQ